jgi:hypothetical protein
MCAGNGVDAAKQLQRSFVVCDSEVKADLEEDFGLQFDGKICAATLALCKRGSAVSIRDDWWNVM